MIHRIYENQQGVLNSMDMEIQDEFKLDGYEMYLVSTGMMKPYYKLDYQIGFQRSDADFTNLEDQFKTFEFDRLPIHAAIKFIEKLKEWIENYGPIAVDSFNERKNNQWNRILSHFDLKVKVKTFKTQGQIYNYQEVSL